MRDTCNLVDGEMVGALYIIVVEIIIMSRLGGGRRGCYRDSTIFVQEV